MSATSRCVYVSLWIRCWDVPVGKVNSTVNPEDVRWKTRHCKLVQTLSLSSQPARFYLWDAYLQGFNVMGIWPPYSNGSEVNSVDVCVEKGLVVTANDRAGLTRLFNYPCVVKIGTFILHWNTDLRFFH